MSKTLAIAQKELSIYFTTVIGYLGFGVYAFILGLVFISQLNRFQQLTALYVSERRPELLASLNFNEQIITPTLSAGLWMFLFFVPFLTMRLFAEEKQSKSFELLMTAPVRSVQIVVGKFLALAVMMAVMATVPLVFPAILQVYGSSAGPGSPVEWAPVLSGLWTIFLVGLSFSGLGLLVSALSETQVVAALLSFALILVAFVLPTLATRLEGDWRALLEYLSPMAHVSRGLAGRLLLADLVYFLSAIASALFFTHRVVESARWR